MIRNSRSPITPSDPDAGITLVELLVAVVVAGILSAIVLNLFISTNKAVGTASSSTMNSRTAANAMDEISRVIRSATNNPLPGGLVQPAVLVASRESLTVIAYVDSDAVDPRPVRVQFTVDPTTRQIVERRWSAKNGANGLFVFDATNSLISTRTLPGRIIAPTESGEPWLFTFLRMDRATPIDPADGSLDEANRRLIATIRVTVVTLGSESAMSKPATLSNVVGMPNLGRLKP